MYEQTVLIYGFYENKYIYVCALPIKPMLNVK